MLYLLHSLRHFKNPEIGWTSKTDEAIRDPYVNYVIDFVSSIPYQFQITNVTTMFLIHQFLDHRRDEHQLHRRFSQLRNW